jgi:hypothetical protein
MTSGEKNTLRLPQTTTDDNDERQKRRHAYLLELLDLLLRERRGLIVRNASCFYGCVCVCVVCVVLCVVVLDREQKKDGVVACPSPAGRSVWWFVWLFRCCATISSMPRGGKRCAPNITYIPHIITTLTTGGTHPHIHTRSRRNSTASSA